MYKQKCNYGPDASPSAPAESPTNYTPVNFVGVKVVMYSYGVENIVRGSILSTRIELGGLDEGLFGRISEAYHAVTDIKIPDNLPEWKQSLVDYALKFGGAHSVHLEIDVGAEQPMDITIIGHDQFAALIPFL